MGQKQGPVKDVAAGNCCRRQPKAVTPAEYWLSHTAQKFAAALNCSIHQDKATLSLFGALGPSARTRLSFALGGVDSKAPPEATRLNFIELGNMLECCKGKYSNSWAWSYLDMGLDSFVKDISCISALYFLFPIYLEILVISLSKNLISRKTFVIFWQV